MIRALSFLLCLNIFLIPLIPALFGFGYELIKVLAFLILVIFEGFIFVYFISIKKLNLKFGKIKWAALFFLIILSLTSVFGINPGNSLTGIFPYYQGLLIYWFLFLYFLMVSTVKQNEKWIVWSIVLSAVLVSATAVFQFYELHVLKKEILTYSGRVISTFGQPNLYSGFLLLSLPFVMTLKKWKINSFLIISTGIFVSLSRSAIILYSGLLAFYLIMNIKQKGLVIFVIGFLIINLTVYSLSENGFLRNEIAYPLVNQGAGSNVEKRIFIIPVVLGIYFQNPLLGYGIDSINELYRGKFADFKPELKNYSPLYFNMMNLTVDRSHNYFLDLLIFSGFFGLAAYLYLIYLLLKTKSPVYLKISLVLYLVWIQFQVQSIVELMLFWFVAGLLDNKNNLSDDES